MSDDPVFIMLDHSPSRHQRERMMARLSRMGFANIVLVCGHEMDASLPPEPPTDYVLNTISDDWAKAVEKNSFMPRLTAHERANPNQPFYARFRKKRKQ